MPDISVALGLLKKPIEALGAAATGEAKDIIARIKAEQSLKRIYQKLNSTQKVKTIWNVERAITLSSFYYPAKIRTSSGQVQAISSLDELPNNAVVLAGTVGQGKSILLRYLLGKEIRSGTRVPIFLELRRTPSLGLEAYVKSTFDDLMETWGHPEIFDLFAKNGRISILMDGFDELDPDRMSAVTTEIEKLATKHPEVRIIVTARPHSGIENSPHFDVIPLAQLEEQDLPAFFQKILPRDKELAQRLSRAVTTPSSNVKSLASTPLLATLLTIVYRAHQKIPADFAEFYDELFQILLVRHDRAKPGYERKRRTKLSDREIQSGFEAFSYKSKSDGASSIARTRALELAAGSLAAQKLQADESHFLADIIKVTCLLQEDGGRIEYLHQSVQEFFAARYVQSRPEEIATRFYQQLIAQKRWYSWDQVLRFLSQIDKHRSSQYFFIPALEMTLAYLESDSVVASPQRLRELISDEIGVKQNMVEDQKHRKKVPKYMVHRIRGRGLYRLDWVQSNIFNLLFGQSPGAKGWQACFQPSVDGVVATYTQIAAHCGMTIQLEQTLTSSVGALKSDLKFHRERVLSLSASASFMGL